MNKTKLMPCENLECHETLRLSLWLYSYYHYGFGVCTKHLKELADIVNSSEE